MMDREWQAILQKYGERVCVHQKDGEERNVRALLQPVLEKNSEQEEPSPLGLQRSDRILYLGPMTVCLIARESRVEWRGKLYDVQFSQPVGPGNGHHWWAVLRPGDEEAV